MVYNYRSDYKHIFDTPAKMEQESVVVNKIIELLNNNKYDSIYDFIEKNHTYQDFLKNNNLTTAIKHFGNTLSEEDFIKIQNEMVKITEKKKSIDTENIKTTTIENKEYNLYEGEEKDYFFDNSHSSMSLERQAEELQKTQKDFQTTDAKENTENIMKELEEEKKESINLKYLHEINFPILNEEEKEIFFAASNYQQNNPTLIRIDIEKGVMVDEDNSIMRIEKNNGEISIIGDNNEIKDTIEKDEPQKTFQKTL